MATLPASADQGGPTAAISAHRGGREGAPPGTYEAYQSALTAGADYLEFDVRRTADGELVAYHDAQVGRGSPVGSLSYAELCRLAGHEVPTTAGLLRLLAGRAGAHIDLKEPDCVAAIASAALAVLEPPCIVVTSGDASAIRELRRRFPTVPAGLTIGGDLARSLQYLTGRIRGRVHSRVDAVTAVSADWAVMHERLARAGVLAQCRRSGLATMVWTVNDDTALARWLSCPDVDVVVTDRPFRAAELRRLRGHDPRAG